MLQRVRLFLEMIRFSHTVFALPFALFAALLAWNQNGFHLHELIGILLCMVLARTVAMAFNRLADRRIDALNPRTAGRHLPAGTLSVGGVAAITVVCALGFVAATALFLLADPPNFWPLLLSVPVLLFICGYSLAKRFTAWAHFWLGASLCLAPVASWIAIKQFDGIVVPILLGLAVFFWVAGFDIIYACQDADFDRQARLRSVPAVLGVRTALRLAFVCHVAMISLLVALYFVAGYVLDSPLGIIYLTGIGIVGILIIYEHSLVKPDDLARVNTAFFNVNAVISVGLLVLLVAELVRVRM